MSDWELENLVRGTLGVLGRLYSQVVELSIAHPRASRADHSHHRVILGSRVVAWSWSRLRIRDRASFACVSPVSVHSSYGPRCSGSP